jgi:hypothetical protein
VTAGRGPSPDAGSLVPQQQGDGLELGADGGRHPAAPGGRLDLADGPGENREHVAAIADTSLLARDGTASAPLALAWLSHKLLL